MVDWRVFRPTTTHGERTRTVLCGGDRGHRRDCLAVRRIRHSSPGGDSIHPNRRVRDRLVSGPDSRQQTGRRGRNCSHAPNVANLPTMSTCSTAAGLTRRLPTRGGCSGYNPTRTLSGPGSANDDGQSHTTSERYVPSYCRVPAGHTLPNRADPPTTGALHTVSYRPVLRLSHHRRTAGYVSAVRVAVPTPSGHQSDCGADYPPVSVSLYAK